MTNERNGWQRPRPLRFAFLVEASQHQELILDGIFADCYNRWGGRFSLIVPCVDGRIVQSFWPWLETFDPDIVYSYVALDRQAVLELHERVYPSEYVFHHVRGEPRLDIFGFKPDYKFAALSSLSGIFSQARYIDAPTKQLHILDSWYGSPGSRFITDNFGTYHTSAETGIFPPDALAAATLLTIVPAEKVADRRHGVDPSLKTLPDEVTGFREIAEGRASCMALASIWRSPRLEIRHDRWSSSFNLVIGDAFADRILHWNARLLIPTWLDQDLCCLRISEQQLSDVTFMEVLKTFLQRRNHVNAGSGGQPVLTVRSTSLSAEALAAATEAIRALPTWGPVMSELVPSLDTSVPDANALKHAREAGGVSARLTNRPSWQAFRWEGKVARPPACTPTHLADAPPRQQFASGWWANDFILEHDGPTAAYGQSNVWQLPLRWRMARAFESKRTTDQHSVPPAPRRSRGGHLTLPSSLSGTIDTIKVPNARESIDFALGRDGAWAKADGEHEMAYPSARICWTQPSNEDSYLTGVLGMAGGLGNACRYLLHPFLRRQFARLGATPDTTDHDQSALLNRLESRASRGPLLLGTAEQREHVADLIVKEARQLRAPMRYIQYQELNTAWNAHREAFWASQGGAPTSDESVDWAAEEQASLDACLQSLRLRKLLFQGHQWTCQRCAHRNWTDLAALAPEMTCDVCREVTQAPVDIKWLFRPNEFLVQSLRDHSVLSLLWVLSEFRYRARVSLVFVGPTWTYHSSEAKTPDGEADLLALVDGSCYLVEVKNSWRACATDDIRALVDQAKRLRPDVAMLAIMDSGLKRREQLDMAKAELQEVGIQFELLTADNSDHDDDPYLPGEG